MKRQFAIFLMVSVTIATLGVIYGSRVITDLTLLYPTVIDVPGTKIVLQPQQSASSEKGYRLDVLDTQRVISQRLNQLHLPGYTGVTIRDNTLEITLPNSEDTPHIINVITSIGEVEFVNGGKTLPLIGQFIESENTTTGTQPAYQTLFTGQDIATIIPPDSEAGDIFYQVELQPAAAKRFANFVQANPQGYACLAIDKQIINCSSMYHLSGNTLDILPNLGGETEMTLADLAVFLRSGPLPMSLEVIIN